MNKRKIILTVVICTGLFLIGVALFTKNHKTSAVEDPPPGFTAFETSSKDGQAKQAPLAQNSLLSSPSTSSEDPCLELKKENSPYASIEKLKTKEKVYPRFENTHLKFEGKIFRLRRFFKEGEENEKEKFLVLEENENEEATLKESNDYKPGTLFQKLSNAETEVIYKEEGVQTQSGVFLHYINGQLQSLQGTIQDKNLDCVMNP